VPTYLVRVNDQLDFVYRFTHEETAEPYRLTVGDEIMVETYPQDADSIRRGDLSRGLQIQPDGTVFLPYAGRISAAGHTIEEIRQDIQKRLTDPNTGKFNPGTVEVVVTPLKTNTNLEDLRSAVDARFGTGGQTRTATVTPEGTIQLVGIGSVPSQGLTISELETEVNARYVDIFGPGVQVSVILRQYAPRFLWVAGEVVQPGQYQINQPLTVVQAIALARGFNNGGNVREIVVFRRDDNWELMATRIDVRGVFLGKTPYPSDDIWLRDNDVVVVPKGPILRTDDFIDLVFTRGVWSVLPFQSTMGVSF
jgi:polysaccharide export outer membrane protein